MLLLLFTYCWCNTDTGDLMWNRSHLLLNHQQDLITKAHFDELTTNQQLREKLQMILPFFLPLPKDFLVGTWIQIVVSYHDGIISTHTKNHEIQNHRSDPNCTWKYVCFKNISFKANWKTKWEISKNSAEIKVTEESSQRKASNACVSSSCYLQLSVKMQSVSCICIIFVHCGGVGLEMDGLWGLRCFFN